MATTPNVVLRTHYYDLKSEGREFYSSNMDDDYLSYIDKGIKTTKVRDYVAYAGDGEKSSGIFSANGLLSKEEKKELREELRETKSTIWDYVISFEEKYGKENRYSWQKAKDLLAKTLPGYFKSIGLDPEKTMWYAGLHENTENRHIHLSFFQKEPTAYDRKSKTRVYRRGKIPIAKINGLKVAIERDRKMTLICCRQKIDPTPYLYRPVFVKDIKRRMGNALIKEIVAKRGVERRKAMGLHHPKARQRLHMLTALDMVLGAVAMSERVSQEAWDAFDEYEAKMRQFEREKEKEEEME
jgi:hypothetical protein